MALDIYSKLLNNDPRMMRSEVRAMIRQQREQQQQQQQAELAEKYAGAAASAGSIDVGGGQNVVQKMLAGPPS